MQKEAVLIKNFRDAKDKNYPKIHFFKIPNSFGKSVSALPYDGYVLYKGIFRAIEFKVNDNEPSEHQKYFLAEVIANGGYSFIYRLRENTGRIHVENLNIGHIEIFENKLGKYLAGLEYIISFQTSPIDLAIVNEIKRNLITP